MKEISQGKYELFSPTESLGEFDDVIMGIPTPNALKILLNSEFLLETNPFPIEFKQFVPKNQYKMIFSLVIGFADSMDLDFYALINFDRAHAISWLSVENQKNGHITDKNTTVLIMQTSDEFSRDLKQKKLDEKNIISMIKAEFFSILPDFKEKTVIFEDLTKWKYALPSSKLNSKFIEFLSGRNIHIIGDGVIGKGRIDGCMRTGIDLYEKIKVKFQD